MKQIKITFLFSQLMTKRLCTGGDTRGKTIATLFQKDKNFSVEIVTPEISKSSFPKFKKIIIGHQRFEKIINKETLFSAFILFFTRTIELISKQSLIKTDLIYATGDFFCNTIPAFIIKIFRPKTKFVVSIHHINNHPFKRKSNFFLANLISYLLQRFSLLLIKSKADLIFAINKEVKNYLISKNFKQKIVVVGNGLDIKNISKDINSLKKIKVKNNISYFGRLSPTKGSLDFPPLLSKLIKKYPDIHLDMIGIALPEIKKPLLNKFNRLGCQGHFRIHNFLKDKKEVFKILLKSKVIVFPSYEEGWGISLFESIMTKRPTVAYNLPIFKEIFKGKLSTAPIGNINTLAKKTDFFIKNYTKTNTKKYIKDCYQIVKKYDWQNVFSLEKQAILKLFK